MRNLLVLSAVWLLAPFLVAADEASDESHRIGPTERALCAFFAGEAPSLAKLGAPAIPVLVESLSSREVECSGKRRALTPDEQAAFLGALAELGREPVLGHLRPLTVLDASPELRSTTLRVLGLLGEPGDVGWMIRLASPNDADAKIDRGLAADLQASLAALVRRHAEPTLAELSSLLRAIRVDLLPPIARAAAARPSEGTLAFLARCLSDTPEVDAVVLTQLGRAAAKAPRPVDEHVVEMVRSLFFFGEPRVKRQASLVLGSLEDHDSIPELVRTLADDDRGVRSNARWALCAISGLDFGPEPGRWNAWHEEQSAWWSERAPALFADLRSRDPAVATRAINDLATRRFRRHDVARDMLVALQRSDHAVVALACHALGQLGSEVALEALVDCLALPNDAVRDSAWRALCSITGRSLPPEREAWEHAVGRLQ